ncbi:MAG: PcfB family protein [Lachnospiraceae bacterium]|nr:PcfB family protein [Lachnospiraceae bacterium]
MQEEVENKAVNLAISTSKLTVRTVMNGVRLYLNHRSKVKVKNSQKAAEVPHGKQTVRELVGQNQGVSTIPIAETELKGFEKVAKKYGVDFAIRKDSSVSPPRYTVFFKARDADALTAAYKEYSAQTMQKAKRPSVRKQLSKLIALTASIPNRIRQKSQERDL